MSLIQQFMAVSSGTCLLVQELHLGPFVDILICADHPKVARVMLATLGKRNDVIHVVLNEARRLIEPVPLVVNLLD